MLYTRAVRQAQADAALSQRPIIHLYTDDRSDFFAVCSGAFFRREEGAPACEGDYADLTQLEEKKETIAEWMDRDCVLYAMADEGRGLGEKLCSYVNAWKLRSISGGRTRCRVVLGGTSLRVPESVKAYVDTIRIAPLEEQDYVRLLEQTRCVQDAPRAAVQKAARFYFRELAGYTQEQARMLLGRIARGPGEYPLLDLSGAAQIISSEKPKLLRSLGLIQVIPSKDKALDPLCAEAKWIEAYRDQIGKRAFGILLVGLPGTGKSMSTEGIARALNMPLLKLDMTFVKERYVGESGRNFRAVLDIVRSFGACIFVIEEIDRVLSGSQSDAGGNGVMPDILRQMLEFLQEPGAPVITIATSNDVSTLDPAIFRTGRFAERFARMLPSYAECRRILCQKLRDCLGLDGESLLDGQKLADYFLGRATVSDGSFQFLTGSDIHELVDSRLRAKLSARRPDLLAQAALAGGGDALTGEAAQALRACIDEAAQGFTAAYHPRSYVGIRKAARSYAAIFGENVIMGGTGGSALCRENFVPDRVLGYVYGGDPKAPLPSCMKEIAAFETDYDEAMYRRMGELMTQCLLEKAPSFAREQIRLHRQEKAACP